MSTRPLSVEPKLEIQRPSPVLDCGRYAPRRTPGEIVVVSADIFGHGHDVIRALVRWRRRDSPSWKESPLRPLDEAGTRWEGQFLVTEIGSFEWTIVAWVDQFATWQDEVSRKIAAGQNDLSGELSEGLALLERLAERTSGAQRERLGTVRARLDDRAQDDRKRARAALSKAVSQIGARFGERSNETALEPTLPIEVDRELARFSSWYEVFPRSWGGFAGLRRQLRRIAELGFDVLYMTPIHPIGQTKRKGRNNTLQAEPGDPGSPYAIGDASGGHTAVHPDLGSMEEFDALVRDAKALGIEIALDLAIQCSADHPWLKEHPEWFQRRPDGTLKYAENPPKKYQDIYNVDWASPHAEALWHALREVVEFWVDRGVRVFRVDNPHTKPLQFWEWLIASVRGTHPDVIFLAEAFTKRVMMQTLAKIGFSQSYTYFTWKPFRWDLTEYVEELATSGEQEYFRPNFFVNTHDILTDELVRGGPPKFRSRLVLAATLSPSYGVYSGFERYENTPLREGSEEYLDSEKYELKRRRLDGPLLPFVAEINRIRREHPALQQFADVDFLETHNDALIAYAKRAGSDVVICVVSLDPDATQAGLCLIPDELHLTPVFRVEDLLTGATYRWRSGGNYVELGPGEAHILWATT